MDAAPKGPARAALRLLFGALLVVSFFLLVLWRTDNPRLIWLRQAMIDFAAPALETVAGPSSGLANMFDDVKSLTELRAENARLKAELLRARRWENDAKRLEQENAQLRALNAVAPSPRIGSVAGEVIADSGGPFSQSVIVNVGRRDGVRDGAPARDALGLVGRVVGVGRRTSRVLLLTDPSSRAPVHVHVAGARLRAILTGDDSITPLLRYVEGDQAVPLEARVTTSGEGGVFPKGLLIGRVASFGDGVARVALAADYRNLEFLRIYRATGLGTDAPDGGLILRAVTPEPDPAPPTPDPEEPTAAPGVLAPGGLVATQDASETAASETAASPDDLEATAVSPAAPAPRPRPAAPPSPPAPAVAAEGAEAGE